MQVTVKVWAAHDRSLWETFDYYVRTYGDGGGRVSTNMRPYANSRGGGLCQCKRSYMNFLNEYLVH